MPRFDIVMTVFNRTEYTKRTIGSLIAAVAVKDCERFILVDNASTEKGMEAFLLDVVKHFPETAGRTFWLRRARNEGWGVAVNDALGLSRAEYVLVLNNDVEFTLDFHTRLLEIFAQQAQIGLLGVWRHSSHGFTPGGVMNEWFREMDDVPAVGWMLPKVAMEKVGMVTEKGPCLTKGGNGEDTDYVQRMKAAGFLTGVPVEDVAFHFDGY